MGKLTNLNNLDKLSKALDARYKELIDEEKARAIAEEQALQSEIDITKEMFGGKSIKYITQAEYDTLTEEERDSDTVTYFIIDAVDLSHDHENKEFLDGLSQEALDNKVDKEDEGLNTEDKTIVGAINELNMECIKAVDFDFDVESIYNKISMHDVDFIDIVVGTNLYDKSKAEIGCFNQETLEFVNSSKYRYNKFKVEPGQVIKAVASSDINYKLFVLLDVNDNILGITSNGGEFSTIRKYLTVDNVGYFCYEFTIPEGISSVYYQHESTLTDVANMFIINDNYPSTYIPYKATYMLDENIYVQNSNISKVAESVVSVLKDKKIGFLGDSFTSSSTYYGKFIEERTGCVSINYGVGGTRITLDSDQGLSFIHRINSMDQDLDDVCVFGGINDASKYSLYETNHGSITDDVLTEDEINEGIEPDTFYSGVKTLINQLIIKYPGKPIIIIIPPHVLDESYNPSLTAYMGIEKIVKALRDCAEYYAIPTIDLYKNAQYLNNHPTNVALYRTSTNNIHPNTLAHKLMSNDIQRALENIVW